MKKLFFALFAFVSVFSFVTFCGTTSCLAMETKAKGNEKMGDSAKACLLIDTFTGQEMFAKNISEKYPIASMCKIMTLLLTFEHIDSGAMKLDDKICVSEKASGMGGSQAFIEAGCNYSVSDLIKTVVVASANDSSIALAETVAGSEQTFVDKMNSRAKELKMNNTVFVNATGLPAPGQYSCAKDVSIMLCELLKHKEYKNYTKIWLEDFKHPTGRTTQITNTNKLVRFYSGCDSGKTGYTSEAGHCVAASAQRDNLRLVAVVIGGENSKSRFAEASSMFNYGFANFKAIEVVGQNSKNENIQNCINIRNAKGKICEVELKEAFFDVVPKNMSTKENKYQIAQVLNDGLAAPIAKGQIVGKVCIAKDNIVIKEIPLIAKHDVEKATYKDILDNIIEKMPITA